mmetsp:Transcript_17730/g.26460  ORF Transcript_17730/g.26460 Transcript_17730/m.26460 type:complete len:88 (+) Transcript_17730:108-371(+)
MLSDVSVKPHPMTTNLVHPIVPGSSHLMVEVKPRPMATKLARPRVWHLSSAGNKLGSSDVIRRVCEASSDDNKLGSSYSTRLVSSDG